MKNFLTNETGLQKVLIPQNRLQERVSGLGREISQAFDGKDLAIVAILKGSFIFAADLIRAMNIQCSIDFMGISSYVDKPGSGVVRITKDLDESIAGRNVLLVEDIIDTGLTANYLLHTLKQRKPASVPPNPLSRFRDPRRICGWVRHGLSTALSQPTAHRNPEIEWRAKSAPRRY